jgi:hypothetical protein
VFCLFKKTSTESVDHSWNAVYKVGGVAFLIIGIWYALGNYWGYIFGIPASGFATPPIATSEAYFNVLANYPFASTIFYSMYSLTDFLAIPALVALYLALKGINKNSMLVAMGLVAVWAFLDVGVTEFNSLTLISLAQSYNAATDVTQRAAYLAASNYALAAIPIATFYSYFIGSLGFLIASIVMLRGVFRKVVALIGIVCNLLGIISAFVLFAPDLAQLIFPTLNLYGLWNILVGAQLIRLGNRTS